MFFCILRINQNIIDKYNHKCVEIWMKNYVHVMHEYCRSIDYTKWHHEILIMTISRLKSSFRNILRLHAYLVVTRSKIDLQKHLAPLNWSIKSSILGNGYLFLIVTLLSCL
ncbi:unnamed protein product [Lupinus luteus]|uniref:Uncharacterized protein n=1 Tax=Lupinus luteus TaxID=3873 RepID=A0AAV1W2M7_LUPLU